MQSRQDATLDCSERRPRTAPEGLRPCDGCIHQLFGGNNFVHEPERQGLVSVEKPSGVQQLEGSAFANEFE